jgi:broad specificity phosphatase PhoE
MPQTRIFLVRHGATILTAEDRFAGATDVPLSDEGRQQAGRLADRLAGVPITAVYASPLGRTMETASILAAPHHLEIQPRDGLREISHGHWEQLTRHEVDEKYPEEAAAWEEDPYTFAPEGGESGLAVTARALPALIRSAPLPRQSRPGSRSTEHRGFQGSRAGAADVVQRHLTLLRRRTGAAATH